MHSYLVEYKNETEYKKLERSLKKYNMLAYKKLFFDLYPSLKKGTFLGNQICEDSYEFDLPTDPLFKRVHGALKILYNIDEERKKVILNTIEPEKILLEGHQTELVTYKGVMLSKCDKEKDIFKINLLNMIQK